MIAIPRGAALVLIDVQVGFDDPRWGERNNSGAETVAGRVLEAWRASGRAVVHVRHDSALPDSPLRPGLPGNAIRDVVAPRPGEPVLGKRVNSAFIGTDLEARLGSGGHDTLVLVGLTTNHCVSTTARMAGNLGFKTYVVADATAAFDVVDHAGRRYDAETVHRVALASLHGEFATVIESAELLRALAAEEAS